jgi:hypothetical protein
MKEGRVVMSLQRLGTRNILCNVGEIYGVVESSILIIVRRIFQIGVNSFAAFICSNSK